MYLLLPPSEAKTAGGRGRPLRHRPVGDGPLDAARARAAAALLQLVTSPAAIAALLLPPAVAEHALAANAAVLESPTTPAIRRYCGTVFAGLDYEALAPAAQRLAGRRVLIFSGLFGVLRGAEPVPEYRVPAKATLPGLGVAGTYWRRVLNTILPGMVGRQLVIDLRSSDYAAMWRPRAARVIQVRVLSPVRGGHAIVSYPSKHAKGRLAAALLRREADGVGVRSADDVAAAWGDCGGASHARTAHGLDLYTA